MVISFMGPPRIYRLARREKEEESFSKKVEDANGTFFSSSDNGQEVPVPKILFFLKRIVVAVLAGEPTMPFRYVFP